MRTRSTLLFAILPTVGLAGNAVPQADIRAVWDLSSQPCMAGASNTMTRNANQEAIQSSRVLELPALNLSFGISPLPDVKGTVIKLFMGDRSRGLTDNYILFSDQASAAPIGALVVTELPQDFDTDKAFLLVATLERRMAVGSGITPKFDRIEGPYGAALEMQIPNRLGTQCFPTSRLQLFPGGSSLQSLGISRFIFVQGKLIEFSLIVRLSAEMKSEEQRKAYVRKSMNDFWDGLVLQ